MLPKGSTTLFASYDDVQEIRTSWWKDIKCCKSHHEAEYLQNKIIISTLKPEPIHLRSSWTTLHQSKWSYSHLLCCWLPLPLQHPSSNSSTVFLVGGTTYSSTTYSVEGYFSRIPWNRNIPLIRPTDIALESHDVSNGDAQHRRSVKEVIEAFSATELSNIDSVSTPFP